MSNYKEIKKLFNKNGFVILKNFISKKLIDEIKRETEKLIKNGSINNQMRDIHYLKTGQLSSVHNIVNYMPKYKKFASHSKLLDVFNEIFGSPQKKWFNSSYFLKPKEVGIATKAHQDNAFFNLNPCEAFTVWIPTESVTKKNSPLYFYVGSQKEGSLPHDPDGNLGASMCLSKNIINKIKKKYKKRYIELKKGDCIIHNPLVVHGSKKNRSQVNRAAFNMSIKSKKAKRYIVGFNDYKKKLRSFLKMKKTPLEQLSL
jgi:ectoine hydroxylase-related dioxygenase (phytanoyl-CoA dioxygenase family)